MFKAYASHSDEDVAAHATIQEAGNLEPFLELSIGCKLMVLENMWTERGIVNGTQCRLYDIVWSEGSQFNQEKPDQPFCLLVGVPKDVYKGPCIEEYSWRQKDYAVIPVYRSQREFWKQGHMRYRSQFPLRLAYAMTIHKAQGMTVPKVVLNISSGRKDLCLFYVAISRVKRIEDLMFEETFDFDRLASDGGSNALMRQLDWDRRAIERLIGANQATMSQFARQGLSQLSQHVIGSVHGS